MDDVGYVHPREVLKLDDDELRQWVADFESRRYGGWRNHDGLWRSTLGLDNTYDNHVLDYGCGFGIESLQFARLGNRITLFDLTEHGLWAARRVLAVHGFDCNTTRWELPEADIFYSNGVLHHTPRLPSIIKEAPCPEARLLLYTDKAFDDNRPSGLPFWRAMDEVGGYADWYTPELLEEVVAPDWKLRESHYITDRGWYMTAILDRA